MAERDPHPIAHVDPDQCYEWMLAECARLHDARQAREDGLIQTVTQVSSAALLAVPALLLGTESGIPGFGRAPALYGGGLMFVAALFAAMLEQHLSGLAFRDQVKIVQRYYLKQSSKVEDAVAVKRLRSTRYAAYGLFATAVLVTAIGLMGIEAPANGKTTLSTVTTSLATPGLTAAPSAATTGDERSGPEVRPGVDTSAPAKTR